MPKVARTVELGVACRDMLEVMLTLKIILYNF